MDSLKIKNQLCFPLYAASRSVVSAYNEHLTKLGLTYTQYITMLVLLEEQSLSVKELGKILYLDSGTLSPMLKKLEKMEYLIRKRDLEDERIVNIVITKQGEQLKEKLAHIPSVMSKNVNLSNEESKLLYELLYKILDDK